MTAALPGIVVITDNNGTWTSGDAIVEVNYTVYTQSFDTDKGTSMTALAAQIAANPSVNSAVYSGGSNTITITPKVGDTLIVTSDLSGLGAYDTMIFSIATTPAYLNWATDGSALLAEPSDGKKILGWQDQEKPPADYINWLFNMINNWIKSELPVSAGSFQIIFDTDTFDTAQKGTVNYKLYENGRVELEIPPIFAANSGGSKSTSMVAIGTPVPIEIRPTDIYTAEYTKIPCIVYDYEEGGILGFVTITEAGAFGISVCSVNANSKIEDGSFSGGTNYKGVQHQIISYMLD